MSVYILPPKALTVSAAVTKCQWQPVCWGQMVLCSGAMGVSYHSDWHVQPDTCLNSHVRTLGWPIVCKLIGILCKTWLLIKRVMATADPIDGSPPGSPVPGILQARILEWVAISLSNAWKWKVKVKSLSHVWLLATPWTAAYQAPLSMGFSRQEYWSGELRLNTIPFLKCVFN